VSEAGPREAGRLRTTVRAYLEIARVSNVPTVVSNALAGSALAGIAHGGLPLPVVARNAAIVATACSLLYVAGMAMNDLCDRSVDAAERPGRPIPSGRVSPSGALAFSATLLAVGVALLLLVDLAAFFTGVALVALIVLYDIVHGRTRWSVLVMGGCRAMVILTAGLALGVPPNGTVIVVPAVLLLAYVAGFSLVARHEAESARAASSRTCPACGYSIKTESGTCSECGAPLDGHGRRRLRFAYAPLLALIPLGSAAVIPSLFAIMRPRSFEAVALVLCFLATTGFMLAWITAAARLVERRPPKIGPAITMWIAAISIVDAYLSLLCGSLPLAFACLACFFLTRAAQRHIAGT
jgi:4-hydroxybenzoate polyprenyltransferase